MKSYLAAVLLTLGLLSSPLSAEPATTASVTLLQDSIDTLGTSVTNQQNLVSKLSDDIGLMADRIGVMADRIVATETLLADTLVILTNNPDLNGGSSNSVALTSPVDAASVSKTLAPTITLVPSSDIYILFASTSPTFTAGTTVSLYVDSTTTLSSKWTQVSDYYTAQGSPANFYIGVKKVTGSVISTISNGVKITFQ
ncbi:hypothetical protein JHD50_01360 [Sulfurimonas sp. MAG313]|nr:hypothetical protein [Sulfurimonas sp. MAG313]MDF1879958.1 hypothetical protein [Sulfurimonas sp. MAG313]